MKNPKRCPTCESPTHLWVEDQEEHQAGAEDKDITILFSTYYDCMNDDCDWTDTGPLVEFTEAVIADW